MSNHYQQKVEQLQKNYELVKEKYKQRLHEERFGSNLSLVCIDFKLKNFLF